MNIQEDIVTWLKTLKGWQTELAYRALTKQIESSDIADILSMIKSNTVFANKVFPNFVKSASEKKLRLLSIESIHNIESLAPRNSLNFEKNKNLIVIYGSNGSGKSGYTKLIKKAAGKQHAVDLKPNVYNIGEKESKCTIKYTLDLIDKSENWIMNKEPIPDLSLIDIFDTDTGDNYLKEANVVTYTPNCMHELVRQLWTRYPQARVVGHRDLSPDLNGNGVIEKFERIKECPCFDAIPEFERLRK